MAFRQPFRSGLRELAESLLRRAQTERAYSQVEQQLELQKGQIGANLAQNLTQNVQGIFAQSGQTYDTKAIRDRISTDMTRLQDSIAQMTAGGINDSRVTEAQALLDNYTALLSLPDSLLPSAYQSMSTEVLSATPSQINAVPGSLPGQSRLPDPGLPGTERTAGDILTRALGGGLLAQQKPEAETYDAGAIRDMVANNVERLDGAISAMRQAGATDEDVAAATTLRNAYDGLMNLSDQALIGAWPQFSTEANANLFTETLAGGATAEQALEFQQGVEQKQVEDLLASLNPSEGFNPFNIANAAIAMDRFNAMQLSPANRRFLETYVQNVQSALLANPDYQAAADLARREVEARTEKAELDVQLGWQAFRRAQVMDPIAYRQAMANLANTNGVIDARSQEKVGVALATGNLAGLSDQEKTALATLLKLENPDEALTEWAQGQVEAYQARVATEDRILGLQEEALETTARLRATNEERDAWRFDREQVAAGREDTRWNWEQATQGHTAWQQKRERILAVIEDKERLFRDEWEIKDAIADAVDNHDPAMIAMFINAIEQRGPLGAQIINAYGNNVEGLLEDLRVGLGVAQEMQALDIEMVRHDADYREAIAAQALLDLRNAEAYEALVPLEIAALKAQYQYDEQRFRDELAKLEFNTATEALGTLGDLARTLPPDFWNNPPRAIQLQLKELGLWDERTGTSPVFQSISEFEQWKDQQPVRDEAWQQIGLYIKTIPQTQEEADQILAGVRREAQRMGMDPVRTGALVAAVTNLWTIEDERLQAYLTNMLGPVTGLSDPVDVARALNGFSSVSSSLMREYSEVIPQQIISNGCGQVVDAERLGGYFVNWTSAGTAESLYGLKQDEIRERLSDTCQVIFDRQINTGNEIRTVNEMQRALADQLGISVGAPAPSDRSPSEWRPTPAPTTGGAPATFPGTPIPVGTPDSGGMPNPRGDVVDWDSYEIKPEDIAKFNEVIKLAREGNDEGFSDIVGWLVSAYGEPKTFEILGLMGLRQRQ